MDDLERYTRKVLGAAREADCAEVAELGRRVSSAGLTEYDAVDCIVALIENPDVLVRLCAVSGFKVTP